VPETRRLFLARTYDEVVEERAFTEQMLELSKATATWSNEVLSRAFDAARAKR